jgi:hypothetical protein
MDGISERQGPHQVAQKFRKTTLPLQELRLLFSPSGKEREKSLGGTFLLKSRNPASSKVFAVPEETALCALAVQAQKRKTTARIITVG